MQKLFFAEWLGGPRRYSEQAHAGLSHTHDGLPITPVLADRWLGHFRRAMEAAVAADNERGVIFAQVRSLAMALVSGQLAPARFPARRNRPGEEDGPWPVAWCGIAARSVARARELAHHGDVAGLGTALAQAPDLLLPWYAAAIMQAAVLAGQAEVVPMLLDGGAGADHPCYLPVSVTGAAFERVVFVTPLCAATVPASGRSTRQRCTTPPGRASCGPSRYSSSTEQTPTPATVRAARRSTGWTRPHRRCHEPQSGTC
jgi:hypothetical protein